VVYVVVACRCVLAAVFALSAAGKVRGPRRFADAVASFRMLPARAVRPVAYGFLAGEAGAAVLLCVPATVVAGFVLSAALLAAFTAAVGQALARKLNVPCPCFGASLAPVGPRHVVRDAVLVAVAGFGLAGALGPDQASAAPGGVVVAVAAAAVVVLLVRFADDLAELIRVP
jgi:hypothetical protein